MSALAVAGAFLRRDFRIAISYKTSFALEFVSSIFLLALFFYLGQIVDDAELSETEGLEGGYFGFVAIGLALLRIVQVSMTSFSAKMREEQTSGTFEALMATPTAPSLVILSSAVYDLLRATIAGVVMIVAAVIIFGLSLDLSPLSLLQTFAALVGLLTLFASLGVAVAAFTVVFKRTGALVGLLLTVLALLGGVYFPIEVFPATLEALANALPFTWGLDVLRSSLLGGEVEAWRIPALFGASALLLPLALIGFVAAVGRARKTGTLTTY
ncbi:MAG: ABC transporter permease [Solirubrobacterales bacterium]